MSTALPLATPPAATADGRPRWAHLAGKLAGRNGWALADQVLISGANFLTVVLPKRAMSGDEFGTFSLVYSVLLLANIVQSTLLTQPHNVLAATRSGDDYRRYTASTGLAQLALAIAEAVAMAAVAAVAYARHAPVAPMLIAMVPSIVAWQLQEFIRRVLYTEGHLIAAFWNDVISYGGQVLVVAALFAAEWTSGRDWLNGTSALYALAGTSAVAAAYGVWQVRRSLSWSFDGAAFWAVVRENWVFGRWLLGGELLQWWSSLQMYMWLTADLLGVAAAGDLRLAQTLFGPMRIFTFYLGNVLPIRFSRELAVGGSAGVHRMFAKACGQVLPLLAAYCVAVAVFRGPLIRLASGSNFAGPPSVLSLYALYTFVSYLPVLLASVLTAKRITWPVFMANVYGAVLALPVGYYLIRHLREPGAPVAMGICSALMAVYFVRAYADSNRQQPAVLVAGGFPVVLPAPAAEAGPAGADGGL
jgi:O-antigen/teichoic acid export membrane protein